MPGAPLPLARPARVEILADRRREFGATAVSCAVDELVAVLAGDRTVHASIAGDPAPLLALTGLLERAQRG